MHRIVIHFITFTLLILLVPQFALAADISEGTRRLVFASAIQENLRGSVARTELVRASKAYCDEISKAFPRNSPAEELWLNAEITAGNDRTVRALGSAEFARRKAQIFVENCLSSAQGYLTEDPKFKLIAVISLAHAFAGFAPDAGNSANRSGVDGNRFSVTLLGTITEAIIYASLMEAAESKGIGSV